MGMQLFGKNYTGSDLRENLASLINELSFIIDYSALHYRKFYTGLWLNIIFHTWPIGQCCGFITQNEAQNTNEPDMKHVIKLYTTQLEIMIKLCIE